MMKLDLKKMKETPNSWSMINDHMIIYQDDSVAAEGFPYSADIFGGVEGDFWI